MIGGTVCVSEAMGKVSGESSGGHSDSITFPSTSPFLPLDGRPKQGGDATTSPFFPYRPLPSLSRAAVPPAPQPREALSIAPALTLPLPQLADSKAIAVVIVIISGHLWPPLTAGACYRPHLPLLARQSLASPWISTDC